MDKKTKEEFDKLKKQINEVCQRLEDNQQILAEMLGGPKKKERKNG